MLRPTTYLVVLLSGIGALHVFGQMYIMTQGGPANSTQSYVMYLYKVAFSPMRNCEFGYASALAFILAGGIFVLSALSQRFNRAADGDSRRGRKGTTEARQTRRTAHGQTWRGEDKARREQRVPKRRRI